MFISLLLAGALTSLPADQNLNAAGEVENTDVAYAEMAQGREQEAVDKILASDLYKQGDPAALINLGTAYARIGKTEKAREAFEAAAASDEQYMLQLADGRWVDSSRAARLAARQLPSDSAFASR